VPEGQVAVKPSADRGPRHDRDGPRGVRHPRSRQHTASAMRWRPWQSGNI